MTNLEMATVTFTRTCTADHMLVSCLCNEGERVEHKNSNVETSIRIRPLNSLALNKPSKFRSKNPGCPSSLLWAHKRRGLLTRPTVNFCNIIDMNAICCQCHIEMTSSSLSRLSIAQNNVNCKKKRVMNLLTSMSIMITYIG